MTKSKGKKHIRFGAILLPYSVSFNRVLQTTLHAEKLGFDSVWISDHLQRNKAPILECWSVICALAAKTKRIRIGSLATCNSFRNPSLLARIIATASNISNGRIDSAIGLGYDETEHIANGFRFPKFKERAEMLSETFQILNSLWTSGKVDFIGRHYKLSGAICNPRPSGQVKLWIAGRNLGLIKMAAKYAYGVNILPYSGTFDKRKLCSIQELEAFSHQIDLISKGREQFGKSMYCGDGGLVISKDSADYENRLKRYAKKENLSFSEMKTRIDNLSLIHGNIEECARGIKKVESLGFEELMMLFPGWQSGNYENMDLFAKEFVGS
jgi:alkanesulfonate monooxygenase SsuD/methylene tetrahydromethanopterin reductase-like flavin-dependent oxidoreductase (luciferase family)